MLEGKRGQGTENEEQNKRSALWYMKQSILLSTNRCNGTQASYHIRSFEAY